MTFHLDQFLPYRLAVAASHVSRAFAARHRKESGLSIAEWRVLAHVAAEGGHSVREIHERVDMDKTKVSRAAAGLTAKGLIEKRARTDDRRLLDLRLTSDGAALFARLTPIANAYQADMLAALGSDAAGFLRGLDALQGDAT